jgi:hypothetical protein
MYWMQDRNNMWSIVWDNLGSSYAAALPSFVSWNHHAADQHYTFRAHEVQAELL